MDIEHERDDLTSEEAALMVYIDALMYLEKYNDEVRADAQLLMVDNWTSGMQFIKIAGLFRACMREDNYIVLRLAKIFPGVDVVRLADALRVEYAIRRLGGRDGPTFR